jgi:WD40 repeat protein
VPSAIPASTIDVYQLIEKARWGKGAIAGGEFSPDGKRLGVITSQGIYIYDAENLTQLDLIPDASAFPVAVFSPDWSLLATGAGPTVTLRRLPDKTEVTHFGTDQGEVTRLLFSPDGHYLAGLVQPPGEEIYTQILDLWSIPDGKFVGTWVAGGTPDVAFAPDSQSIYTWNVFTMDAAHRWQIPSGSNMPMEKDWHPLMLVTSPDGLLMAWADRFATNPGIVIRRTADGTQVLKLAWDHMDSADKLVFTKDGSRLVAVAADGMVKVWKVADGSLISSFKNGSMSQIQAISPNGQTLVLAEADGLVFYNLTDGHIVRRLEGHMGTIDQAVLSPRGDRLAALIGNIDPAAVSLVVWSIPDGKILYLLTLAGALRLAWSPAGDRLALAGWDGKIRVLRATDGDVIQTLAGFPQQVQSLFWSADGTQIASSSFSVKVWRVADGTLLYDLEGSGQWIDSLHFSPDEKVLAGFDADGKVNVWRISDRKLIAELPVTAYGDSNVIEFAPDGSFIAVAEMSRLSLWHFNEDHAFLQMPVINAGVITLRISPDVSLLAGGLTDGTIQLWQITQGKLLRSLKGGNDGISSLDFSADGKTLLSASRDGTMRFWGVQ